MKKNIKKNWNTKFTLKNLQQICEVYNFYKLSWIESDGSQDLIIQFISETCYKESRKNEFYGCLIQKVKAFHSKFIQNLPSKPVLDPVKIKTWHYNFDLHSLPDLPLFPLPEKDLFSSSFTSKKTWISDGFSDISTVDSDTNAKNDKNCQNSHYLLIQLCEVIRVIFSAHKIPTMYFAHLVDKITEFFGTCLKGIENKIIKIVEYLPESIKIIESDTGDIVRCSPLRTWSTKDLEDQLLKSE